MESRGRQTQIIDLTGDEMVDTGVPASAKPNQNAIEDTQSQLSEVMESNFANPFPR